MPPDGASELLQPTLFSDEAAPLPAAGDRPLIARVLIEDAALELDYAIPESLAGRIQLGTRVRVPLQRQRATGTVLQLLADSPFPGTLKPLVDTIGARPVFPPALLALARWAASYYLVSLRLMLRAMLPESVRRKPESFLSDSQLTLARMPSEDELAKLRKSAPVQARIIESLHARAEPVALSELRRELPRATQVVHLLVKKGIVARAEMRVERDPFQDEEFIASTPHVLTEEQAVALDRVLRNLAAPADSKPMLLHGVTGSGKTEIYLQAIAHVLDRGQSALVLVPEISLTPQTIERFKARFSARKERIAVLHSHLSDGERHDEWYKIHEGRADIVIGARSAIFAPLENVGLIIVDEEHEPSYKQEETPRYHARDLAVVRARLERCACLLGSATPALESFENASTGKYELLTLTRRTDGKSMPLIRIVDLRLEGRRTREGSSVLSEPLRIAIEKRLQKQEQVILFLNRRGFNTALTCLKCGETAQCSDCSVSLTFHKTENRLVCHICGTRRLPPSKCGKCGDPSIRYGGFGTERAEESIRAVFKDARIARVDTDSMRRKNQLRDTLRNFRAQKLDILIGTQMIAKGLDFPNVTLVGVLHADLALHLPDFRAGERTFQLLTQVAGRSGRGEQKGEVMIQTFAPHSPAIQFARHADYHGFAEQELEQRRALEYPPFTHAVLIGCRGKQLTLAEFTLQSFARRVLERLPEGTQHGEPCPSPLTRAHGQYRFQWLLRTAKLRPLLAHLQSVISNLTLPEDVVLTWDIDAMSLL